jgi:drug/metabolite transporter (DMT)-like permease
MGRLDRSPSSVGIGAALIAMVGWSASGVITKGLDMPGMAIVLYRMWLYTAVMVAVLGMSGRVLTPRVLRVALPGGIGLGLDIALFFSAVKETTIANATIITALQPLLTLTLGPLLFGLTERASRRDMGLAGIAMGGVAIVLFGSAGLPDWHPRGDLMAAGALFAWTAYFIYSKRSQSQISTLEYTAATALIAALINTPIAFASGQELGWPAGGNWGWLVLLALGPGLIGHVFMNWSLTRIPIWLGATLSLFIPVTSTLMAWLFIDEDVAALQFGGMALVLLALTAIVLSPRTAPIQQPLPAEASAPG